jgi:Tol biopolymer transport system component
VCALLLAPTARAGDTERVSVDGIGVEGDDTSSDPEISASGRFVVFESDATNLAPTVGPTNSFQDVFVHDRKTGETARVSVDSQGLEGNAGSDSPSISANGRFVAFASDATNLAPTPGLTNLFRDVFVHDRKRGETTRASVDAAGVEGDAASSSPAISADGRYVAFESDAASLVPSDTNDMTDVFVHDRKTGETTRVSRASPTVAATARGSFGTPQPNGPSSNPVVSANGRYVAFESLATNLVPGLGQNAFRDVFVHDRKTGETRRVSVDSAGAEGDEPSANPSISANGRYVAFESLATNLVPGDEEGLHVFVHDRKTGETTLVSLAPECAAMAVACSSPDISASGRYVAYQARDGNVGGDSDVFVYDRKTGETALGSVNGAGVEANDQSFSPELSASGRYVVFSSVADNLVPFDTNMVRDVFVHDRK